MYLYYCKYYRCPPFLPALMFFPFILLKKRVYAHCFPFSPSIPYYLKTHLSFHDATFSWFILSPFLLSGDNFTLLKSWRPSRVIQLSISYFIHHNVIEYSPPPLSWRWLPYPHAPLSPSAPQRPRSIIHVSSVAVPTHSIPLPTSMCKFFHPYCLLWIFPSLKNFLRCSALHHQPFPKRSPPPCLPLAASHQSLSFTQCDFGLSYSVTAAPQVALET